MGSNPYQTHTWNRSHYSKFPSLNFVSSFHRLAYHSVISIFSRQFCSYQASKFKSCNQMSLKIAEIYVTILFSKIKTCVSYQIPIDFSMYLICFYYYIQKRKFPGSKDIQTLLEISFFCAKKGQNPNNHFKLIHVYQLIYETI